MKTLLKLIILVCGCWILSYYGDWKFSLIFPFTISLFFPHRSIWRELGIAFIAVFLVWISAAIIIDGGNNSILSNRLAGVFGLLHGSTIVIITGILGGILGLAGAFTGHYLRQSFYFSPKKE